MASPGWPERSKATRSFRQLRRFHHGINSNKVFGTHTFIAVPWLLSAASAWYLKMRMMLREAEAQSLLLVMAFCQRLGDVFMARAGKGPWKACSYRVEEGTADAPKLAFAA
jgi:hypothetical protein